MLPDLLDQFGMTSALWGSSCPKPTETQIHSALFSAEDMKV